MVINLCLPQFRPRIHCNKISADGYEVENLISEDLVKRSRGFRTEYFIKPPVHVTVSFPFNVEIGKINVDLTAGGVQNITGLEMYTSASSDSPVTSSTSEHNTKKMKLDMEPGLTHMDCSSGAISHEQRLSESLDVALTSALSTLPSFTGRLMKAQPQLLSAGNPSSSFWSSSSGSEQTWSSLGPGCTSCSRTFSPYFKTEPVYQLPCGHLICRACLAERQRALSILCGSCKKPVASQDVLRVHL
ncbi:RING finger protein 37 isoform X6 [Monodelphis domestica]|uniref:RING finger protein 37 isoform X6 n=1 Tax=Monodelphis domestica TaxID=13616 RepID=UPI0024E19871|nr:RING finger protein 37 isoform X6 [Monodelphis domestica]